MRYRFTVLGLRLEKDGLLRVVLLGYRKWAASEWIEEGVVLGSAETILRYRYEYMAQY